MTQKKLEIIGPYTPEHEGPYAIDTEANAKTLFERVNIHCIVNGVAFVTTENHDGPWCAKTAHLLNAREVPVAREFWVNKYNSRVGSSAYPTKTIADNFASGDRVECIHVREVLPGEGA